MFLLSETEHKHLKSLKCFTKKILSEILYSFSYNILLSTILSLCFSQDTFQKVNIVFLANVNLVFLIA